MNTSKPVIAIILIPMSATVMAGSSHDRYANDLGNVVYDSAKVVEVRPVYREVEVTHPVKECWEEPVIHAHGESGHKSASGMAVGGILGGIVGHQIGKGSSNRLATAIGTIIGAQIGHNAVNGHTEQTGYTEYQQRCAMRDQVSYKEVLDGYRVSYRYQNERYQIKMPYDPGKRINLRIRIEPVI
jgi:uncharacterized protein YcfJ